jgi:hypothetical protein
VVEEVIALCYALYQLVVVVVGLRLPVAYGEC